MTKYTDSEGVRYIAKPAKLNSKGTPTCSGCVHKSKRDEESTPGCIEAPYCNGEMLDDAIIWVRQHD